MDHSMSINKNTVVAGAGLPPIPPRPSQSRKVDNKTDIEPAIGIEALTLETQSQDQDPNSDKKLKRAIASRRYSQKYREKKNNHMISLQVQEKALETEVTIKSPRVKYSECCKSLLQAENRSLKQKLLACSEILTYKNAEFEQLQKQKETLRQLYAAQQQMHLDNQSKFKLNPTY